MGGNRPRDLESRTFLVVDDEPDARDLLVRILTSLGAVSISTAKDGRKALEILKSWPRHPDVLLLDLRMPRMTGPEMLTELADIGCTSDLILVSAAGRESLVVTQELSRARGFTVLGYVTKPIERKRLAALLGDEASPQ